MGPGDWLILPVAMPSQPKIIFLIDDSPLIISRLRSLLQGINGISEIRSADSFEAAEALLAEQRPNLVILDIHLGGQSGIDLLRHIQDRYPAVTVYMLSNQSSPHYRALCREMGAAHFIDKSTEFGQIRALIGACCQG
jgi:DNA-binding NarL/FixJ family response regulator